MLGVCKISRCVNLYPSNVKAMIILSRGVWFPNLRGVFTPSRGGVKIPRIIINV